MRLKSRSWVERILARSDCGGGKTFTPENISLGSMPTPDHRGTVIVTGADSNHFSNLRVLIGSSLAHMSSTRFFVCDYGLLEGQLAELRRIAGLTILQISGVSANAPIGLTEGMVG